ncbi:hypothetical protein C8J57DRAFT_1612503 [Mycena rebaudengoi]|nr:hypothetical protein C8J57DRAFT_1612503 [Mycena rebaudengoi]
MVKPGHGRIDGDAPVADEKDPGGLRGTTPQTSELPMPTREMLPLHPKMEATSSSVCASMLGSGWPEICVSGRGKRIWTSVNVPVGCLFDRPSHRPQQFLSCVIIFEDTNEFEQDSASSEICTRNSVVSIPRAPNIKSFFTVDSEAWLPLESADEQLLACWGDQYYLGERVRNWIYIIFLGENHVLLLVFVQRYLPNDDIIPS